MMLRRRALLSAPLAAAALPAAGGAVLSPGSHRIEFPEGRGDPPGPMAVHLHRPAAWRPDGAVVVVMHGLRRDADAYRDAWVPHAEAHGFLLLCPQFAERHFPGALWYNFGHAIDVGGRPLPEAAWSFAAVDDAAAAAAAACGATRTGFALYGHSAGAQFVHRYLLLTGAPRASRLVIANAGSYAMPRFDTAYPFGLGGTMESEVGLSAALGRRVVVLLGEADTDPQHKALPRGPEAAAQGPHRLARGQAFFAAAAAAAERLHVRFAWRLQTVPGVGHSNSGMAAVAAPLLAG